MNQPSGCHGNVLHTKIYLSCFFFLLLFTCSQLLIPFPIPILTIFTVILPSLTAPEVSDNSLYLVQQEDLGKVSQMACSELVSFNTDTCPVLPDLLTYSNKSRGSSCLDAVAEVVQADGTKIRRSIL